MKEERRKGICLQSQTDISSAFVHEAHPGWLERPCGRLTNWIHLLLPVLGDTNPSLL